MTPPISQADYMRRWTAGDSPGREALVAHLESRLGPEHRRIALPAERRLRAAWDPSAPPETLEDVSLRARPASDVGPAHLLYAGFGLSDLDFDADLAGETVSGMGIEPVFRLAAAEADVAAAPTWPCELLNVIGRLALETPEAVVPGFLAMLPEPLLPEGEIAALLLITDPELDVAQTPHGTVDLHLAVGVTRAEAEAMVQKRVTIAAMLAALERAGAGVVTDPVRRGSVL